MGVLKRIAVLSGGLAALVLVGLALRPAPDEPPELPYLPKPTELIPGEGGTSEFSRQRRAWMASMRMAAPGVDAAALDGAYRNARDLRFQAQRDVALSAAGKPLDLMQFSTAAIAGTWSERGSINQSGRVLSAAFDSAQQRLTVLSHGGNV